ncbi:MAG: hypothetical protein OXD44_10360 [Gammaproteobacteria bacterium]|nr:hypothetical protein [Gammaproteobacteria bacterium]MCY4314070.1 hypothetical protein [Gammaproteobacteria bacterium]
MSYDALKTAEIQSKTTLMVHSEAAAIPQDVKTYAERAAMLSS